jgi:lipopolysaccharide transport system ATP-binding protein
MSKPVIEVKNLSKVYNISHEQKASAGNATLVDTLSGIARKPIELITGHKLQKEKFWALKDVNFEINQGDVVGIIGRNGSGKSTLLKVLSRIVEPTKGEIHMRGKVASLLEVGTGFHPELTGRENIFFNGAILGMSQKEIRAKFDEIVAFSEVEKFLDTPVKFYSSGMYVRLAFSVAAHLDPDILIVDEVLAVGDAAFQKKCLGKMKDVAGQGRTVLFVSHSMQTVQALCNKGILMKHGEIVSAGNMTRVIDAYSNPEDANNSGIWEHDGSLDNKYFTPINFSIGSGGKVKNRFTASDIIDVEINVEIKKPDPLLTIGIGIYGRDNLTMFWSYPIDMADSRWPKLKLGHNKLATKIPAHLLNDGDYRIELLGTLYYVSWILEPEKNAPALSFEIRGGLSESSYFVQPRPGVIAPILDWKLK